MHHIFSNIFWFDKEAVTLHAWPYHVLWSIYALTDFAVDSYNVKLAVAKSMIACRHAAEMWLFLRCEMCTIPFLRMSWSSVVWSLCLRVGHDRQPCKNGRNDQDATRGRLVLAQGIVEVHIRAARLVRRDNTCRSGDVGCCYHYCSNLLLFPNQRISKN